MISIDGRWWLMYKRGNSRNRLGDEMVKRERDLIVVIEGREEGVRWHEELNG